MRALNLELNLLCSTFQFSIAAGMRGNMRDKIKFSLTKTNCEGGRWTIGDRKEGMRGRGLPS